MPRSGETAAWRPSGRSGVPVGGEVDPGLDRRPAADVLWVVLGPHDGDVVASVAADGFGITDPEQRRSDS